MSQPTDDALSRPDKLLTLLASFSTDESPWSTDELGAILAHQLDARLSESVPQQTDDASSSLTLRTVLHDPSTSLETLDRVKRFAKEASVNAELGIPKEVATVLYLAVIVAARLSGRSLTKLDDATFHERIAWALQRPWLSGDLREMFERINPSPRPQ